MMKCARKSFVLLTFLLCTSLSAQVATGTQAFGSFGGGPFDSINLGNLNVHFAVPILHKAGRGVPFDYALSYDSSIWTPGTVNGTLQWVPAANWGWTAQTLATIGYLYTATTDSQGTPIKCSGGFGVYTTYTSTYTYYDWLGQSHPFPGSTWDKVGSGGCSGTTYGPTLQAVATDGSGYSLTAPANQTGDKVTTKFGAIVATNVGGGGGSGSTQDANGNYVSVNSSTRQFYDTLSGSTAVLTLAGTGTPSSPITYSYTAPSGSAAKYTVNYTQYTVATDFGVGGVAEFGRTSVALVSSIQLPDTTEYQFTYEATPGSCTPLSGTYANNCVTGRIASVSLPTGGTVDYGYTGGSNGIESDGSTASLTRQLSTDTGSWSYTRQLVSGTPGPGSTWTTTVVDPNGNNSVINFAEDSTTNGTNTAATYSFYETQRKVYQGSSTLLVTTTHCYNANYASCSTATVHSIISQVDAYTALPNGSTRLSETLYNTYGLATDDKEYDYGVSTGGAPGTSHLIRETAVTYATLSNGIVGQPASVNVYDWTTGSKVLLAASSFGYDQTSVTSTTGTPQHASISGSRGNLTTATYQTTSGGSTISRTYTYYDTGNLNTAVDFHGATTTYNYSSASCGNSFVTSVSEPLSLSKSMTWNCTGGVMTQLTDENGQIVKTNYTNADFWRPDNTVDQENNQTSLNYYTGPTAVESSLPFNSGNSTVDVRTTVDGFGRSILTQRLQGPTLTTYDTSETDYNNVGLPDRFTMPFKATQGGTSSSAPATTVNYDALGRPTQVSAADGGSAAYTYTNNDVLVTVTGSQTFKKQLEYDGLGRLTSVCEISTTLTGRGACNQTTTQTGFWTKYTYDALGRLLTVTQNAQTSPQTRSYGYDMAGRMTSETNPESATTTYTYDSACTTTPASPGNLTGKVDGAGNHTCFYYDALNRLNGGGWNSVCHVYNYDTSVTPPSGVTVVNTKARLVEAATTNCGSTVYSDEWFSYSPRGELTDFYEWTSHSGTYYHTSAGYWPSGNLQTLSGIPSVPTMNYGATTGAGLDGEGRYTQVTAGSGPNPVTSVSYDMAGTSNPVGSLTGVTYGSSDSDSFTYYLNTGRPETYAFNVNGQSDTGTLTWNTNGTLASLGIADNVSGSTDTQSCTYSYDDLARAAGISCGTKGSQSFSYDAFGNISKTANGLGTSFLPASYNSANQPVVSGMSFDADGNTKTDNLGNAYAWDPNWGNLTSVNTLATIYDALGRVVEQQTGSGYTQILYSPIGKVALMSGTTLTKAFVPLPGGGTAVYNTTSGLAYYRHADWLGSSRLASTQSRTLYSSTAYAPFGEPYLGSGASDASFTGQNQDTLSSLYDFTFRRLSHSQGRWVSPDPAGLASADPTSPQTWNRYAYVANQPSSLVDSLGLQIDGPGQCSIEGDPCGGGTDHPGPPIQGANIFDLMQITEVVSDFGYWYGSWPMGSISGPGYFGTVSLVGMQWGTLEMGSGSVLEISGGPASGGGVSSAAGGLPAPNNPCANSTLAAAGTTAQQQIATAQGYIAAGQLGAGANPYANPVLSSLLGGMYGYFEAVNTGGPNDIKNQPGPGYHNQLGVDAGNISFGITCPYGALFCQYAAGQAQYVAALFGKASFGSPWTFMDTPSDNASIKVGQAMRAAGCHE